MLAGLGFIVLLGTTVGVGSATSHTTAFPGENGEILFGVDWPSRLDFGGTDPDSLRVEACGVALNGSSRRWSVGQPGLVTTYASMAPNDPRVALTRVGASAQVALTNPRQLQPKRVIEGGSASWSPDGRSIVFVAGTSPALPNSAELFILDLQHNAVRQLTSDIFDALQPRWSPDGKEVAFVSTDSGSNQIWLINADGSGQRQLTAEPGTSVSPGWSPVGRRLVFSSDRTGKELLYTMSDDGTNVSQVGRGVPGASPVWSPDGRKLAFRRGEHLRVVSVDGKQDHLAFAGPIEWGPSDWARRLSIPAGQECIRWGTSRAEGITGTRFDDVIEAGAGNDRVVAGDGDDQIIGDLGADRIDAGVGSDWVDGGPGSDVITGGGGNDHLFDGPGNDTIYARDGQRDVILCGRGRDVVYADKLDVVARDCEGVLRGDK